MVLFELVASTEYHLASFESEDYDQVLCLSQFLLLFIRPSEHDHNIGQWIKKCMIERWLILKKVYDSFYYTLFNGVNLVTKY